MARRLPVTDLGTRHPLRRLLTSSIGFEETPARRAREDVAFFLISFASAFIILYGFVV